MADRLQQVCFAEADTAVDEQRVVGVPGWVGDGEGGGVREAVVGADDKGIEGVVGADAQFVNRAMVGHSSVAHRRRRGMVGGLGDEANCKKPTRGFERGVGKDAGGLAAEVLNLRA